MTSLNAQQIKEIIPHRYPFLLVDKIVELEKGKKATGYKNVTVNEEFFNGHFPDNPVMPGVLIIEALAQVGAVAMLSTEEFAGKTAYFTGINKAKFRRKVVPGDVLKLEAELVKARRNAGVAKVEASVEGQKAADAEIMFMIG
ncbi:3-hydroxyacyl-ACP dehydratase FabZ [Proteinivorax hydrogeniformans]|uniref:3-hydroxyacyl-[acyl-carrier-protein] dehydratase FabZ n=1 Tax=Proteinivorax hydrogeniformans TaxID=1826727 RepID=A0AAU8HVJ6_9FIRM